MLYRFSSTKLYLYRPQPPAVRQLFKQAQNILTFYQKKGALTSTKRAPSLMPFSIRLLKLKMAAAAALLSLPILSNEISLMSAKLLLS